MTTMIGRVFLLVRKELRSLFTSPIAYVMSAFFIFMMGWVFINYLINSQSVREGSLTLTVIQPIFANMHFFLLVISPIVTMRLVSEEKKEKTLGLLLRSHLSDWEIICGKYLAGVVLQLFMVGLTLVFPLILALSGYSDWGVIALSYLGIALVIASYTAIGLFVSTLTENQVVAALVTFCLILALMLFSQSTLVMSNFVLAQIFRYLSLSPHFEPFARGVVLLSDLIYFATLNLFALLLAWKSLESRKW